MSVIEVHNQGPLVLSSTYWGSEYEKAEKIFCSVNAGAIRLLAPRTNKEVAQEARKAEYMILSRGPWPKKGLSEAVEILFEDHSEGPYVLHLSPESFDLLPAAPPGDREWRLAVWEMQEGGPALVVERVCHWRKVSSIPCLKGWEE